MKEKVTCMAMSDVKIATRLTLLIGFLSIILLTIGGVGLYGISASTSALRSVYQDRTVALGRLADVQQGMLHNQISIGTMLLEPLPELITKLKTRIDEENNRIDKVWEAYLSNSLDPEEARIAKEFVESRSKFEELGVNPTIKALRINDPAKAVDYGLNKMPSLYEPTRERLAALVKIQIDGAASAYAAAEQRSKTIYWSSIGAVIAGLFFASLGGFFLVRSISGSLREAVGVSKRIGAGDLTHPVSDAGRNEIGVLLDALRTMQDDLVGVVSAVRSGSEGVASASTEIAQGNHDLSTRTEQQASALQETAASMEELSNAIKQNAGNANQANQLAQSASAVAIQGGNVVNQVVETMKGINESSIHISEIISVIDGIAFQTNILALNAAVEAARAGEQGRGFAVVASEVRSLAGRSADAAKQIKQLINASVERVEYGTRLVDQAGTTMIEVVSAIRKVTAIMAEINAASSNQALGVQQVGAAVRQMDQSTQQNAALVEQMAAAASTLQLLANAQVQAVSAFTLPAKLAMESGATQHKFPFSSLVEETTPLKPSSLQLSQV
ncbi:MAG: HAMP domain-containing protein [Curvibacter sp.]|nr:MAG: HAMP domain-containing protein [Curvibacter sp.]